MEDEEALWPRPSCVPCCVTLRAVDYDSTWCN